MSGPMLSLLKAPKRGGHGQTARSTLPFVPTEVDALSKHAPDVIVVAAGGIADGRGLAAALMLGAEGVLMGSRFWATQEALIHPNAKAKVVAHQVCPCSRATHGNIAVETTLV
jgi:nitronate monooxygenase